MTKLPWHQAQATWGRGLGTIFWFSLSVMIDLICLVWARRKILREFRRAATQQFEQARQERPAGLFRLRRRAIAT